MIDRVVDPFDREISGSPSLRIATIVLSEELIKYGALAVPSINVFFLTTIRNYELLHYQIFPSCCNTYKLFFPFFCHLDINF